VGSIGGHPSRRPGGPGTRVTAGQPLGTLYNLGDNGHLHLGIRPLASGEVASSVILRGSTTCPSIGSVPDLYGYVNPIPWLQSRAPQPPPPVLQDARYVNGGTALHFTPPPVPAGVTIRGYQYHFSCNGGSSYSVNNTSAVTSPLIVGGACSQGSFNSVRIAAKVDGGCSAYSDWKTVGPPIAAPTLTGAKLFTGGATLTMVAPAVPSGTTIRGYLYNFSCNGGLSWTQGSLANFTGFSGTVSSSTCTAPSVPSYRIAARVDGGYSAWSSWRSGTTV
jgi:hypothetical protein